MKRILMAMLFVFISITSAYALELEVKTTRMIYDNDDLKADPGFEVRLKHKDVFLYGSTNPVYMFAQWVDMNSVGVGFQHRLYEGLYIYFKGGYDMPDYDATGFGAEGIWFYQCQYLAPTYAPHKPFKHYTTEIDDSMTGEVGIDYKKQLWKDLYVGMSAGWKVAKLDVATFGVDEGGIPGTTGWQVIRNWDFGGYCVGFSVEWKF